MSCGYYMSDCVACGRGEDKYDKRLRLFRFPADTERCRAWIKAIGKKELLYKTMEELQEYSICDAHFPPECINGKSNLLHKVALPTMCSPYPPLSNKVVSEWPKKKKPSSDFPVMLNVNQHRKFDNTEISKKPTAKSLATVSGDSEIFKDPVIDYDLPLMNCVETLIHDKKHAVKKPAGNLNSISVPLMSYCSSLEHGTVFAASDPKDLFKLDLKLKKMKNNGVELLQKSDNSMYMNTEAITDVESEFTEKSDVGYTPNTETLSHRYKTFHNLTNDKDTNDKIFSDNVTPNIAKYPHKMAHKKYTYTETTGPIFTNNPDMTLNAMMVHPYKKSYLQNREFNTLLSPNTGKIDSGIEVSKNTTSTNPLDVTLTYTKTGGKMDEHNVAGCKHNLLTMYPSESSILVEPSIEPIQKKYKTTTDATDMNTFKVSTGPNTLITGREHKTKALDVSITPNMDQGFIVSIGPNTIITGRRAITDLSYTTTAADATHTNYTDGSAKLNTRTIETPRKVYIGPKTLITARGFKSAIGSLPTNASNESMRPNTGSNESPRNIYIGPKTIITARGVNSAAGSSQTNASNSSTRPNTGSNETSRNVYIGPKTLITARGFKSQTRSSPINISGDSVRPYTRSNETSKNIYIDPNTLIITRGFKSATGSSPTNVSEDSERPNSGSNETPRKVYIGPKTLITTRGLKATVDPLQTNDDSVKNTGSEVPGCTTADSSQGNIVVASLVHLGLQTLIKKREDQVTEDIDTDKTIDDSDIQNTPDNSNVTMIPSSGYTNTPDISFVPYSEYEANVSPESLDAHIAGNTLDYGLPLMNCIGTVLQGNIHTSPILEEPDDSTIDVPLMKCFKTLEHLNDL